MFLIRVDRIDKGLESSVGGGGGGGSVYQLPWSSLKS